MHPLDDPLPLFHGTSKDGADSVLADGFRAPDVVGRLRALATRYDVDYDELAAEEMLWFVWQRNNFDINVSLATSPRLAASYARRGSEIEYFGLQAVYRLAVTRTDESAKAWRMAAEEWAKAEVARTQSPVVIRLAVPLDQLGPQAGTIAHAAGHPPDLQQVMNGIEVIIPPGIASSSVVGVESVAPCTCWRDGRPCPPCADWTRSPGGWNGTFPLDA